MATAKSIGNRGLPAPAITTFEGWHTYVSQPELKKPDVPTPAEWAAMSAAAQRKSKKERQIWHSGFPPVKIAAQERIIRSATRLAILNYRAPPGARLGVAIDGLGTLGKSTTMMVLGRRYELAVRKSLGLGLSDNLTENIFIPVVYITVTSGTTIKGFDELLVDYYGIPGANKTTGRMTATIARVAQECGTTLILIDDIHFLKMKNRAAQEVNDHIKALASRISATFVFAGIDLEGSGFFAEGVSEGKREISQTDHRLVRHPLDSSKKTTENLRNMLREFENSLCLINHHEGDLVALEDYIHDRTDGFTGAIAHLIRQGANLAISTRVERLSQQLLNKIKLDRASERHWSAVRGQGSA